VQQLEGDPGMQIFCEGFSKEHQSSLFPLLFSILFFPVHGTQLQNTKQLSGVHSYSCGLPINIFLSTSVHAYRKSRMSQKIATMLCNFELFR